MVTSAEHHYAQVCFHVFVLLVWLHTVYQSLIKGVDGLDCSNYVSLLRAILLCLTSACDTLMSHFCMRYSCLFTGSECTQCPTTKFVETACTKTANAVGECWTWNAVAKDVIWIGIWSFKAWITRVLSANRVDFGFYFASKISNFTSPPPPGSQVVLGSEATKRGRR